MIDPETFQASVMKWNIHNFPLGGQNKHWALLGIVEEVGELCEALSARDERKMKDAIGDIMVFNAAFCGFNGMNLFDSAKEHADVYDTMLWPEQALVLELPKLTGQLCHHFLKSEQSIRGYHHKDVLKRLVGWLTSALGVMCAHLEWDFLEVIDETWKEVEKRDWIKFPKNGCSDVEEPPKNKPVDKVRIPGAPGKFKIKLTRNLRGETVEEVPF